MSFLNSSSVKIKQKLNASKRFILSATLINILFLFSFIVTLSFFSGMTGLKFIRDWARDDDFVHFFTIAATLVFGIVFCVFSELIYEKVFQNTLFKKASRILIWTISLCVSSIPYLLLRSAVLNKETVQFNYSVMGIAGTVISLIVMIFYFADQTDFSKTFSYIFKNIFFNFFVCGLFFLGCSLCVAAFVVLIWGESYKNTTDISVLFALLGEVVGILTFFHLCLAALPDKNRELTVPKVFKTVVLNVLFPVYMGLLSILYIYFFKILITWTFPSGQINWFVSISSLLYVFFVFALKQYKEESKTISLFLKYSGYVIILTILVQFFAIYIRISNYGLTPPRYASIVLNFFVMIFAVLTLFRREKTLKNSLIILSCFVLMLTLMTPLSLFDAPLIEQAYRLHRLLLKNKMVENGRLIQNDNLDSDEKKKIMSAYKSLMKIPSFKCPYVNLDFLPAEIFANGKNASLEGESVKEINIFGFTDINFS
jgi:MFS family permease